MLSKSVFGLKVEEEEKLSCIPNDRLICFQSWSLSTSSPSHIPLGIKLATQKTEQKQTKQTNNNNKQTRWVSTDVA